MIRLFHSKETNFSHNGMQILDDICISAVVEEELNGIYNLELEFITHNNSKWQDIKEDRIIKINTVINDQLFRIERIKKEKRNILKVFCRHIFFDLERNFLEDVRAEKRSGSSALDYFLRNTTDNHNFRCTSDISTVNTMYAVRLNFITMLFGNQENSFMKRWGGELEVDNFSFSINQKRGSNRGVEIRYGKNLTGFEGVLDLQGVVTKIKPVGFDGITLPPREFVTSSIASNYSSNLIAKVDFPDIKVKQDPNNAEEEGFNSLVDAQDALRAEASKLFSELDLDKPKTSFKVNFISLEDTDQYKDFAILERCYLGDTVTVVEDENNLKIENRIVSYRFDCLSNRYIEIILGNKLDNFFDSLQNNINNSASSSGGTGGGGNGGSGGGGGNIDIDSILQQAKEQAKQLMEEGVVDSFVVCRKNEILILKDTVNVAEARQLIRMNRNGIFLLKNGYHGTPTEAITHEGINASVINFGTLNGRLIKADTIEANALTVTAVSKIREGLATVAQLQVLEDKISLRVESVENKLTELGVSDYKVNLYQIHKAPPKIVFKMFDKEKDITDTIPSHWLFWTRISKNPEEDLVWNGNVGSSGIREVVATDPYFLGSRIRLTVDDGKTRITSS